MNDKTVIAAGIVAAGAIITSAVQTIRVSDLKRDLRMKESDLTFWKRSYMSALKRMSAQQILDLMGDHALDNKFRDITQNF